MGEIFRCLCPNIARSRENENAGIDCRELASVSTWSVFEFAFFCRSKRGSRDKNYCNIFIVEAIDNDVF